MKKLLFALLLTSPGLALASPASVPPALADYVDAQGEIVGQVIYQDVHNKTYVVSIKQETNNATGTTTAPLFIQGVAWEGNKIYKRQDGSCIAEARSSLKIEDKETSLGVIQLPSYDRHVSGIKCPK